MWFVLFPFFNIILPPCCFIGYFLLTGLQYFCQVTFCDPEAAKRACTNANPVIDGRKANCNLASLGRPVRLWPYGIISFHILRFLFVRNMSLHFICVKCSLCLWMDQVGWCYFILDSLWERVINSCLSFYIFLSCILSARETILFAFVFSCVCQGIKGHHHQWGVCRPQGVHIWEVPCISHRVLMVISKECNIPHIGDFWFFIWWPHMLNCVPNSRLITAIGVVYVKSKELKFQLYKESSDSMFFHWPFPGAKCGPDNWLSLNWYIHLQHLKVHKFIAVETERPLDFNLIF